LHRVIHDWSMWGSRTIFRIDFRSSVPTVRIFRGGTSSDRATPVTGSRVSALLVGCRDAEAAAQVLKPTLRLSDRRLLVHKNVLWVDY
jgi:hypothetical protein